MIFRFLTFWIVLNVILLQNLACQAFFQQRYFEEILHRHGEMCPSNTLRQEKEASVVRCGMLLPTDQGSLVFTFDNKEHICRTYREEDFNGCVFQTCSNCRSYKVDQSKGNVTVNEGKIDWLMIDCDIFFRFFENFIFTPLELHEIPYV